MNRIILLLFQLKNGIFRINGTIGIMSGFRNIRKFDKYSIPFFFLVKMQDGAVLMSAS